MPGRGRHGKPGRRARRAAPRPSRAARWRWRAAAAGLALAAVAATVLVARWPHPAPGVAGAGLRMPSPAAGRSAARSTTAGRAGQAGTGPAGTAGRGAGGGEPAPGDPAAGQQAAGGRAAGRTGTGTGAAGEPGAATAMSFCPVPRTPAVSAALARVVPGSDRDEIEPLGVAGDGRGAYVAAWTPGFSGVAEVSLATGALREIKAFAHPATDQADGTASGRYLVWAQTYSLSSLDRFTMYARDAATGRLLRLGQSIAGPGGVPWPSPWHPPAVSGTYAAWAQGYGPGGLVEIRLANLVTGQVTTIRRGHTQPPLFDGGLLIWPESDAPGAQTTLRAYSLAAHRLVALPAALAAVHGTEFVVTDGTRTAYLDPSLTRLYYSARPDQPARLALALPAGTDFASLALAPGTLAWTTSRATYLASTRTGAYTQVTADYGFATGSRSVLLVSDAPGVKAVHPPLPLHVISPAALSWPRCGPAT
jgi:hypothetical protein